MSLKIIITKVRKHKIKKILKKKILFLLKIFSSIIRNSLNFRKERSIYLFLQLLRASSLTNKNSKLLTEYKIYPKYPKRLFPIESNIDNMNNQLPEIKNFIIPGGHKISSYCHICRSICRRAERKISELNNHYQINPCILSYVNRLSDFFFVLSRYIKHSDNIKETYW